MVSEIRGFRLSPQQRRIWLLQRDSGFYNSSAAILIEGNLNKQLLKRALEEVVKRHEILRTSFHREPGISFPIQIPLEIAVPSWQEIDLSHHNPAQQDRVIEDAFCESIRDVFDIARGPLVHSTLAALSLNKHILLVTMPALCADTRTLNNIALEIGRCYGALSARIELADEPTQYVQFSDYANELLDEEADDAILADYFEKSAADDPPTLPFESEAAEEPEIDIKSFALTLVPGVATGIRAIVDNYDCPPAVVLMAAWQTLLWRLSGSQFITVWSVFDGRPFEELHEALGLYSLSAPIQCYFENGLQFKEILMQLEQAMANASSLQEQLVKRQPSEASSNEAEPGHSKIAFEVEEQIWKNEFAGLTLSTYKQCAVTDAFKLKLFCALKEGALAAELHYNSAVYSSSYLKRIGGMFSTLLYSATLNPEAPVGDLELLSEAEKYELLFVWNDTEKIAPRSKSFPELFEEQVERTPEHIAIAYGAQQLTYREVDRRVKKLARHLQRLGAAPEAFVALYLDRSLEMVIGLLATMKAGAAYLPIETSYPEERVNFILKDAAVEVVLTQKDLLAQISETAAKVIALDDWCAPAAESDETLTSRALAENPAYVIYTSGSTGQPKGVVVTHRGLTNYLNWCYEAYPASRGGLVPVHSSISFDLTVTSLLFPLTVGDAVMLLPEEAGLAPLISAIREVGECSFLKITPAHLAILNGSLKEEELAGKIEALIIGGEALYGESLSLWRKYSPGTRLINEYGPTEAVVGCSVYEASANDSSRGSIPIGRPISNTQIYVLDRKLCPGHVGGLGELFIAGESLARGYLNQPDLTADRFIPNPFSSSPGSRMYRSGDIARLLPDSNLLFLGRADHQVKIRGFRIELAEVEAAIRLHHLVSDCAVISSSSPGTDSTSNRLLAYVVSDIPAHLLSTSLREWLKLKLPDFMLPSLFISIPRLPLTTNGKLDRKALPPADSSGSASQPGFQAARTPVEQQLVSIWSEVLGVASPGINDNFFELGGHSLLATQLISRLRLVFNLDLDLKLVFDSPTILEQASFIHLRLADADPSHSSPQILAVPRHDPLPLSFAQQRLWFLNQLDPHSFAYNISCAVLLSGQLNLLALRHSINHIIRRHESLRTSFDSLDGKPVQIISQQFDLDIEVVDLSELAESQRQPRAVQLAGELGRQGFDLCRLPLLRACLFKLDDLSHILGVTLHHIISDGWSMGLIVKELASLYNAFVEGRQPLLDPLPIQYGDYAVWQRQWLCGQLLDRQLCYWKQQLAGPLPVLQMPTDRPRPPSQSFKGSSVPLRLKPELTLQLKAMARREGVTLYMLLLAAFYSLLFRYTSEPDIILGTPVANRALPEVEGLIGFFVNTLAIRVRMEPDQPFASLLSMVRQQCLGAYANQDVPFEKLVAELQPERSLSHSPLFQVLFAFQQQVIRSAPMRGLDLEQVELTSGISKFDLSLSFTEQAHHLEGVLEYSSELFDEQSMWRMMGHLEMLLEAIAQNPHSPLAHLPMLTIEEMKQLQEWNQSASHYDSSLTIGEMIERQGDQRGDSVAVVSGELHLTYRQMNRRANQLSRYMRRLGVGPEQRVGVLMSRGAEMVEAVVAVLKSGAAYVPLDAEYPLERLDFMMRDAGVSLLLTQRKHAEHLKIENPRSIYLEEEYGNITYNHDGSDITVVDGSNAAYIIYTSGSTGQPKGVVIEHRSVTALVDWASKVFSREALAGVLASTSICFDLSIFEMFVPLCLGGSIILADSALDLPHLIDSTNITLINTVPSAIAELIRVNAIPDTARTINLAGEPLQPSLAEEIYQLETVEHLYNLYGPTEDTTYSTYTLIERAQRSRITIGRPISNTQTYVLDAHLQPLPVGVNGELFISGHGLARGYLNQPDLTADRFIPNPFSSSPGSRMYRSGDIARLLPDSNLLFLGRADHQVKIRGFRIELAEVEAAIRLHHLVSDCAVVSSSVSSSSSGTDSTSNRLVAYVVSDIAAHVLSTSLREWLKLKLPDFMLPSLFISIPGLPLTSNGKLDRKALPPADSSGSASQPGFQPARTPVEQQLVSIWSDVLGVASPGINDNFFELGGHSLLATQLISRLRLVFNLDLDLKLVFDSPTILQQASFIHLRLADADPSHSSPQILPVPRLDPLPLSFAQQRLWFLDQLDPHSFAYNISCAVLLSGQLNLLALRHSINHIIRRHESLRTSFDSLDGKPVQIISQQFDLDIEVVDLSELAESRRQPSALQLAGELGRQSFDLCRLPLLRACLFKLDDLSHMLGVTLHHIISDGWSMGLIVKELASLYNAFADGRQPLLEPLPIQYGDYAVWQRQWLSGQLLDRQLCYWKQQLAGPLPVLQMPTDRPRPPSQSFKGSSVPLRLKPELTHQLKAMARREGVTLYMLLLAAFYSLLFRYTSQLDIILGTPVANRALPEVEGLIGFFVNTLAIRVRMEADQPFASLLSMVRQQCLGAYANQDVPFEKLVAELQPERSLSHSPLFQVLFAFQQQVIRSAPMRGLDLEQVELTSGISKFDLSLSFTEQAHHLEGVLEYSGELFDEQSMWRMIGHLEVLLEAISRNPLTAVAHLQMLTIEEMKQLQEWNQSASPYDSSLTIGEMIERQGDQRGDSVAVVSGELHLTYRQMNRRANQLSRYMRRLGVGPEQRVGVLMSRGAEMVEAVVAVLKSGAAYVPLDVEYPLERLDFMMRDGGVSLLLTQKGRAEAMRLEGVRVVEVEEERVEIEKESGGAIEAEIEQENLAYIIYTSGSTGAQKGVMISHRSILNRLLWGEKFIPLDESDRMLHLASCSFDVSIWEILTPLIAGARLVISGLNERQDSKHIIETLIREEITIIGFVPTLLKFLLQEEPIQGCHLLKHVFCGGEAMPAELQEMFFAKLSAALHNFYGPTETTIDALFWTCSPGNSSEVPIGYPLGNTQAYVCDSNLERVPVGIPGELHIGGEGLARGYSGHPEMTAEKFIPSPFGEAGSRLYKTGDRVRYRCDGSIDFLGRLDRQVKVRGLRIELAEIEAVLLEHPSIEEAVVIASANKNGQGKANQQMMRDTDLLDAFDASLAGLNPEERRSLEALLENIEKLPSEEVEDAIGNLVR